jgi:hypothetical protein
MKFDRTNVKAKAGSPDYHELKKRSTFHNCLKCDCYALFCVGDFVGQGNTLLGLHARGV